MSGHHLSDVRFRYVELIVAAGTPVSGSLASNLCDEVALVRPRIGNLTRMDQGAGNQWEYIWLWYS